MPVRVCPWMDGMSQGARDGGATMYRMDGQKIAPAFSALPPSLAVVCRGAMSLQGCN